MVEATFRLMIPTSRQIPLADRTVKVGHCTCLMDSHLFRRMLCIVGLGRFRKEVAKPGLPDALLRNDVVRGKAFAAKHDLGYVNLPTLLREADCISVHTVLTPATSSFTDRVKLGMMKPTTSSMNIYRGPVVKEGRRWALTNGVVTGSTVDDDAHSNYERSLENGIRTRSPPVLIPHGLRVGWYTMDGYDSDGISIELMQRPKEGQCQRADFFFERGWLQPRSVPDVVGNHPGAEVTVE